MVTGAAPGGNEADRAVVRGSASRWRLRQPAEHLERAWRAAGLWSEETLGSTIDDRLSRYSDRPFTFRSEVRPWRGTYGEIRGLALRAAEGLARRGVKSGDIVAFQLPNWVEAAIHLLRRDLPRRPHRADRAHLWAEGGRLHPPAHRGGRLRDGGPLRPHRLPRPAPGGPIRGPGPRARAGRGRRPDARRNRAVCGAARGPRARQTGLGRSLRPRPGGLHLRHDVRSQGGRPLRPDAPRARSATSR